METILQRNRDIDGVIAGNDTMALGAVAALKSAGLTTRSRSSASTAARTRSRRSRRTDDATVLQPAALIAQMAVEQADEIDQERQAASPEKQSIDCEARSTRRPNASQIGVVEKTA
jgi:erythritol transport system substrate-binding protein